MRSSDIRKMLRVETFLHVKRSQLKWWCLQECPTGKRPGNMLGSSWRSWRKWLRGSTCLILGTCSSDLDKWPNINGWICDLTETCPEGNESWLKTLKLGAKFNLTNFFKSNFRSGKHAENTLRSSLALPLFLTIHTFLMPLCFKIYYSYIMVIYGAFRCWETNDNPVPNWVINGPIGFSIMVGWGSSLPLCLRVFSHACWFKKCFEKEKWIFLTEMTSKFHQTKRLKAKTGSR